VLVHRPDECYNRDNDDVQLEGVPEFMRSWPESDVLDWDRTRPAELAREANDGGCWTGSEYRLDLTRTRCSAYNTDCWVVTASSVDQFPFVGSVPNREGHWMAAGFVGHGKHRYLCSLSCSYTHDLRYATDPSLDSLRCSRCAELILTSTSSVFVTARHRFKHRASYFASSPACL